MLLTTSLYSGLLRQPKYGHLKELHKAIKLCEHALVSADPTVISLGSYQQVYPSWRRALFLLAIGLIPSQINLQMVNSNIIIFQAHVFSSGRGSCAAFLSNFHPKSSARVIFNNVHYDLPPWSVSILPNCRTVVFNTATVSKVLIGCPFAASFFVPEPGLYPNDYFFSINMFFKSLDKQITDDHFSKPLDSCIFCYFLFTG